MRPTNPLLTIGLASFLWLSCAQESAFSGDAVPGSAPGAAVTGHTAAPLESLAAAAPTWDPATSLATARAQHVAVLLPTGKVLIAGGVNRTGFVDSPEVFNPADGTWAPLPAAGIQGNVASGLLLPSGDALVMTDGSTSARRFDHRTGTWTATGPMAASRSLMSLTLLQSGKVLVAGGSNLSTAEIYDPETNAFAPTGSLSAIHRAHAAVLLRDGRVLLVSGFNNVDGEVPNAELFDPWTETWSFAAPPLVPRHYATATLLPDGRVLLAGGFTGSGITTHSELYDPVANTWTATGALSHPRNGHTAALLPTGKVLVTGGSDGARNAQSVAELYDPATGTWSPAATLHVGRENHTATLLPSGKLLVTGGYSSNPSLTFFADAELYDPAETRRFNAGSMAAPRAAEAVLLASGQVLLAGGALGDGTPVATTSLYDPATNAWTDGPPLQTARAQASVTLLEDGEVLVVGGVDGSDDTLATAERFDPLTSSWKAARPITEGRVQHTATRLSDGSVLIVGGRVGTGAVTSSAERYVASEDAWSAGPALSEGRHAHAAVRLIDGRILVAGGALGNDTAIASSELLSPTGDGWTTTGALNAARTRFTLTLLPDGRVLAVGGQDGAAALSSAEVFDPATGAWSPTGSLASGRVNHTAALMTSGKVLIAGGQSNGGAAATTFEIYDPALGTFTAIGGAPGSVALSSVSLPNGSVLLVGPGLAQGAEQFDGQGAQPAWRPVLSAPEPLFAGCEATLTGTGFLGISEGSSGSYLNSAANAPQVRLHDPENGALWTLPARDHSATRATVPVPAELEPGAYALSVISNAITGGRMVQVERNLAPVALASEVSVQQDTATRLELRGSDENAGQALTLTVLSPPAHGTLSGSPPDLVYTPAAGYLGPDSLTFRYSDCGSHSAPAVVSLNVVKAVPPDDVVPPDDSVPPEAPQPEGCSCQAQAGSRGAGPGALTLLAGLLAWMHQRRRRAGENVG